MAAIDDFVLTTDEDGYLFARDSDGRTLSAPEYYEAFVDSTYIKETGRPADGPGRAYWLNTLMTGQTTPDQLGQLFSSTDEGTKFDLINAASDAGTTIVTKNDTSTVVPDTKTDTGGITTVVPGTTVVPDTKIVTKNDTSTVVPDTKTGTGGITKVTTTGTVSRADADGLVTRLYDGQFGRRPTQADLDFWAPQVVAGNLNEDGLLREFNASSEGRMFDRIGDLYPLEVGRAADPSGQSYYAGQVRDGKLTFEQISKLMSETTEGRNFDLNNLSKGILSTGYVDPRYLTRLTKINSLYKNKFGRDPDEAGLRFYLGQEDENYDFNQAIVQSPEALVRDAFKRVFGRAPDAEGLTYYMDELKKGRTYDQIVSDLRRSDEYQTKVSPVRGPGDVLYSNPATAAQAGKDFGGFPLVSKAVTGADGKVTNKLELNLPAQKDFSLGLKTDEFKAYTPTVYAESPFVSNIFGGASKADMDRGGVGAQRVFSIPATATQDYSKLGIGTTGGITSLADVTKAAGAAPFTLGNTMANNLGTNLGTTAGTTLDLASNAGTIGMAEGGMVMSDPVMRRAMVRGPGPVSSKGYGITSNVTTPDENAMAMQTMFQPPGFRDGGPVQYFQEGGEAEVVEEPAPLTPLERLRAQTRTSEPRFKSVMDVYREGRMLPIDREQEYTGRSMRGENVNEPSANISKPLPRPGIAGIIMDAYGRAGGVSGIGRSIAESIPGGRGSVNAPQERAAADRVAALEAQASAQMAQRRQDIDDADRQRDSTARGAAADRQERAPDAERRVPVRDSYEVRLDKLKAEREANKAQRRENQLLALMQAGFAMAAGRSPNALANISAGGASGVATLAGLEKDRRAEDTALRREILETELAGERTREARAERQAGREQTAAQRQLSLLQNVSANTRSEIQAVSSDIIAAKTKLATMAQQGVPEAAMAEVKAEIEKLNIQREAAKEQRDSIFESLGIKRPKTPDQQDAGFKFLGAKK